MSKSLENTEVAAPPKKVKHPTYSDRSVVIEPALAEEWLDRTARNRPLTQSYIDAYSRDMKRGQWHKTGDAIKFNEYGELIDGQHRLWACILAGAAFETKVAYGVRDEARIVIDTGRKRTLGNYFAISGEQNANQLAAIVNLCWRYDSGQFDIGPDHVGKQSPTHEEAAEWLAQNPGVRASLDLAGPARRALKLPLPAILAPHYLWSRDYDTEFSDDFWTATCSGANLSEKSPELAFRKWAMNVALKRDRPKGDVILFYSMKAMAAKAAGRRISIVIVRPGEPIAKVAPAP